jgi:hypothetical protein
MRVQRPNVPARAWVYMPPKQFIWRAITPAGCALGGTGPRNPTKEDKALWPTVRGSAVTSVWPVSPPP